MKLFLALLLLLPVLAQAEIRNISWSNAVLNEDGTVFVPATDQREIRLTCFKGTDTTPSVFISPSDAIVIAVDFAIGTHSCTAQTVANSGEISQPSGALAITISPNLPPIPLAPSGLAEQ